MGGGGEGGGNQTTCQCVYWRRGNVGKGGGVRWRSDTVPLCIMHGVCETAAGVDACDGTKSAVVGIPRKLCTCQRVSVNSRMPGEVRPWRDRDGCTILQQNKWPGPPEEDMDVPRTSVCFPLCRCVQRRDRRGGNMTLIGQPAFAFPSGRGGQRQVSEKGRPMSDGELD